MNKLPKHKTGEIIAMEVSANIRISKQIISELKAELLVPVWERFAENESSDWGVI